MEMADRLMVFGNSLGLRRAVLELRKPRDTLRRSMCSLPGF